MIHRLARSDDFAAIAAITNHFIRTTAVHFGYEEIDDEEPRALWRQHEDRYPWLVGELDGVVVGYAKAGTFRARSAYQWITETGIYLAPEHCGKGYGRPLYARLIRVLSAQGFRTAIGGIALPNDVSVRLHEQLGFVHRGTVQQAGRKFDRWHDVGFWQLRLQDDDTAKTLRTPVVGFDASAT